MVANVRAYWPAKYSGSICIPGGHAIRKGTQITRWGDASNRRYACMRCALRYDKTHPVKKKERTASVQGELF